MKKVMMKITGKQVSGTEQDQMEFVTEGSLYEKANALYLIYEESEISGMPGFHTRLKLTDDKVIMKRIGQGITGTEMEFQLAKRYTGHYYTPYGNLEMEILTNQLENSLTAEGTGKVCIDYNMSLKGLVESRNQLNIEII